MALPAASTQRSSRPLPRRPRPRSNRCRDQDPALRRRQRTRRPACSRSSRIGYDVGLRSRHRKIDQRRGPHRRRTSGAAEFGHDDEDFGEPAFACLRAENSNPRRPACARSPISSSGDGRRRRGHAAPVLIEEPRMDPRSIARDVIARLFGRRPSPGLALAEPGLALLLERHRRLLVVGSLERHLLQRHRGFQQHVDALLDDLVDRQLGPANGPCRAVGELDRDLARPWPAPPRAARRD